jgi:hypothetical protein
VVELRAVDGGEAGLVEGLDVDSADLRADLWAQAPNFEHRSVLPSTLRAVEDSTRPRLPAKRGFTRVASGDDARG